MATSTRKILTEGAIHQLTVSRNEIGEAPGFQHWILGDGQPQSTRVEGAEILSSPCVDPVEVSLEYVNWLASKYIFLFYRCSPIFRRP